MRICSLIIAIIFCGYASAEKSDPINLAFSAKVCVKGECEYPKVAAENIQIEITEEAPKFWNGEAVFEHNYAGIKLFTKIGLTISNFGGPQVNLRVERTDAEGFLDLGRVELMTTDLSKINVTYIRLPLIKRGDVRIEGFVTIGPAQ